MSSAASAEYATAAMTVESMGIRHRKSVKNAVFSIPCASSDAALVETAAAAWNAVGSPSWSWHRALKPAAATFSTILDGMECRASTRNAIDS
jgi:hypothetical protein